MPRKSRMKMIGVVAVLSLLGAGVAVGAEMGMMGWGLRAGLSSGPDGFFVGTHLDLGEFVENLHFLPNATVLFGDAGKRDQTIVSLSPDILYTFPAEGVGHLYAGGILALQYIRNDKADKDSGFDDADTEVGVHAVAGLMLESAPILLELNIGLDDAPDLKAAIGYTFRSE